jgi:predicted nucleotidyltransferase
MNQEIAARKNLLASELARFVKILQMREDTERILVFGSWVSGELHAWSDLDLVIVQQTQLPFYKRLRQMRQLLNPKVGADILVYTPDEIEQLKRDRPFFQQEILDKSTVVYERHR